MLFLLLCQSGLLLLLFHSLSLYILYSYYDEPPSFWVEQIFFLLGFVRVYSKCIIFCRCGSHTFHTLREIKKKQRFVSILDKFISFFSVPAEENRRVSRWEKQRAHTLRMKGMPYVTAQREPNLPHKAHLDQNLFVFSTKWNENIHVNRGNFTRIQYVRA